MGLHTLQCRDREKRLQKCFYASKPKIIKANTNIICAAFRNLNWNRSSIHFYSLTATDRLQISIEIKTAFIDQHLKMCQFKVVIGKSLDGLLMDVWVLKFDIWFPGEISLSKIQQNMMRRTSSFTHACVQFINLQFM